MNATRYAGELLDGQSAALRRVTVVIDLGGLRLYDATTEATVDLWAFTGLQVDPLHGGVLHVEHAQRPGALLTSRDPALPAALSAASVRVVTHARGGRLARQIVLFGAAVALAVVAVYLSLTPLSRVLARRVPLNIEEKLGVQIESFVETDYCRNQAATAALDGLTARLSSTPLDGPAATRVSVINWDDVNAFTFPGGKVVVTRGLLDAAEGPDELAGVLAHELEHVRQRHIMSHLIRSSILSLGWSITVGDFSGLFVVDPSTAFTIANQSFSRADERSADSGALVRLDGANISRDGFGAFFRRIEKKTDVLPPWLSTHPASKDRLASIAEGAPGRPTTPALTAAQWSALKAACADGATR